MIPLPIASALAALPLFLGVALATFLLMRRLARRRKAEQKLERAERGHVAEPAISPGRTPPEFLRIQVELQEMHREFSARLDTKMSALMTLIQQADARIAELDRRLENGAEQPRLTAKATNGEPSADAELSTSGADASNDSSQADA